MVEQFGFATIPRCPSSASGLTSATTSGTSGSIRQREELSTTTAPSAAKRGAHSPDTPPPAEKMAMSKPRMVSSASGRTTMPLGSSRPAERSEAKGTISVGRERALLERLEHHAADRAGGADDGDLS